MWIGKIGAKASAFINHKPFHPSSLQNLQKVWEAEEKHEREQQRIKTILEKREEERKITELREALHSTDENPTVDLNKHGAYGSLAYKNNSGSDGYSSASVHAAEETLSKKNKSFKAIWDEIDLMHVGGLHIPKSRKTKRKVCTENNKDGFAGHEDVSEGNGFKGNLATGADSVRKANVSTLYQEDIFRGGHSTVWGSFYSLKSRNWGYACCKETDKEASCSVQPASSVHKNGDSKSALVRTKGRDEKPYARANMGNLEVSDSAKSGAPLNGPDSIIDEVNPQRVDYSDGFVPSKVYQPRSAQENCSNTVESTNSLLVVHQTHRQNNFPGKQVCVLPFAREKRGRDPDVRDQENVMEKKSKSRKSQGLSGILDRLKHESSVD